VKCKIIAGNTYLRVCLGCFLSPAWVGVDTGADRGRDAGAEQGQEEQSETQKQSEEQEKGGQMLVQ
jgi:hypothetical protein